MKKILIFIAASIMMVGCNHIDLNKPFVIGQIERLDKDKCRYYDYRHTDEYATELYFVDSAKKYQMGDTVKFIFK